jgi:hypothetical protein
MDFWIGFGLGVCALPVSIGLCLAVRFAWEFASLLAAANRVAKKAMHEATAAHLREELREKMIRAGRARDVMAAEAREREGR